jgi:hypothetical protein
LLKIAVNNAIYPITPQQPHWNKLWELNPCRYGKSSFRTRIMVWTVSMAIHIN